MIYNKKIEWGKDKINTFLSEPRVQKIMVSKFKEVSIK
jgi:hypothetical protein